MTRHLLASIAAGLAAAMLAAPVVDAAKPKPAARADAVSATLKAVAAEIDPNNLQGFDAKLVDFGTRSTLSDTKSDTRGIGAARRWVESEMHKDSAACGGCLDISTVSDTVTGDRYKQPTEVVDVVAMLKGTVEPNRVIIIQGHMDSRNSDNFNVTDDAPGANDDGSGTSAVLEAARVLSKRKYAATLVFAALSGEEQGLNGGRILAAYAKKQGWQVEAVLNNDIVGAVEGMEGMKDDKTVRVFSEGVRALETAEMARGRRANGGELDSPSRNLARYIAHIAETYLGDFRVRMIYRMDRYGRGGDQAPMQEVGFPAVRVTEGIENYDRQHQNIRTEDGRVYGDTIDHVDFPYLAKVTRLNALTMVSLANAPAPPTAVKVEGAVSPNTTVKWTPSPGADHYLVWWRDTTSPLWQHADQALGSASELKLKHVIVDDWFFGVSAVSKEGYSSPVVFAGLAGDFRTPNGPSAPPP